MPFEPACRNIDGLISFRSLFNRARRSLTLLPVLAIAGICLFVCDPQLARSTPPGPAGQSVSATPLSFAQTQEIIAKATLHGVKWAGPNRGQPPSRESVLLSLRK